jgi:uncharacterized membrane protein
VDERAAPASSDGWRYERGSEEFGRLLSFTDGVVAIALTLLILNIDLPEPQPGQPAEPLFSAIAGLGDQFVAFILSFVLIGFYWIRHHRFIAGLKAIDATMLTWSLFYLLLIVLMPFTAEVIGFYSGDPDAIVVYACWFAAFGVVSSVGYLVAVQRGLTTDRHEPGRIRAEVVERMVTPAVFIASIPLAYLFSGQVAMTSWVLVWPAAALVGRWGARYGA